MPAAAVRYITDGTEVSSQYHGVLYTTRIALKLASYIAKCLQLYKFKLHCKV